MLDNSLPLVFQTLVLDEAQQLLNRVDCHGSFALQLLAAEHDRTSYVSDHTILHAVAKTNTNSCWRKTACKPLPVILFVYFFVVDGNIIITMISNYYEMNSFDRYKKRLSYEIRNKVERITTTYCCCFGIFASCNVTN